MAAAWGLTTGAANTFPLHGHRHQQALLFSQGKLLFCSASTCFFLLPGLTTGAASTCFITTATGKALHLSPVYLLEQQATVSSPHKRLLWSSCSAVADRAAGLPHFYQTTFTSAGTKSTLLTCCHHCAMGNYLQSNINIPRVASTGRTQEAKLMDASGFEDSDTTTAVFSHIIQTLIYK